MQETPDTSKGSMGQRAWYAVEETFGPFSFEKLAELLTQNGFVKMTAEKLRNWKDGDSGPLQRDLEPLQQICGATRVWIESKKGPGPVEGRWLRVLNSQGLDVVIRCQKRLNKNGRHKSTDDGKVKKVECMPWRGPARWGLEAKSPRLGDSIHVGDGVIFDARPHKDGQVVHARKGIENLIAVFKDFNGGGYLFDEIEGEPAPAKGWEIVGVCVEVVREIPGGGDAHFRYPDGLKPDGIFSKNS